MAGKPGNPNWVKGVSGNPGPKYARDPKTSNELDVRALAQKFTIPAIMTAVSIMKNTKNPPAVRLSAADMLLKRGHGMPIQPVANPDLTPLNFAEMSDDMLMANAGRLDAMLAKAGVLSAAQKTNDGKMH